MRVCVVRCKVSRVPERFGVGDWTSKRFGCGVQHFGALAGESNCSER
jgi:hypothetical protein